MSVTVSTFGGVVQSVRVPDRDGRPINVALGFGSLPTWDVYGLPCNTPTWPSSSSPDINRADQTSFPAATGYGAAGRSSFGA